MKVAGLKDTIAKFELTKADQAVLADLYTDQRYYPTLKKLLEMLRLEAHTTGFAMSNSFEQLQFFKGQAYAYKEMHSWLKKNHKDNLKAEEIS